MNSGDSVMDASSEDLDDEGLLDLYRNSRKINSKTLLSPTTSTSVQSKLKSPAKVDSLSYQDFKSLDTDDSAHFIEHKIQFNVPIYQKSAFQTMSLRQQVQMLCAYHTHIAINITRQARKNYDCVPLPKLISSSARCSTSLRKDYEQDDDEAPNIPDPFNALLDIPPEEEYVSRSGRITKRKFYSETTIDVKKIKPNEDDDWKNQTKVSPSTSKGTNRAKPDTNSKTPQNKTLSKTNQDIISRSPLFRDNSGRLAKIAEGVEQKTYKDRAEEKKVEQFQSTLDVDEHYIEDVNSDSSDSMTRTVVVPPKPGTRGRKPAEPKMQKTKPTQKKQPQKKPPDIPKDEPIATKKTSKKMVSCPICNIEFGSKDIEGHASSCGENVMPTRSHNSGPLYVSCPNCDMVILEDEDRETHIRNCS